MPAWSERARSLSLSLQRGSSGLPQAFRYSLLDGWRAAPEPFRTRFPQLLSRCPQLVALPDLVRMFITGGPEKKLFAGGRGYEGQRDAARSLSFGGAGSESGRGNTRAEGAINNGSLRQRRDNV